MEYLISIQRIGYEIRTVLDIEDETLSDEGIRILAEEKLIELGVDTFEDDSWVVDLL